MSEHKIYDELAEERRKFRAETATTSYLAGVMRDNHVPCQSFQHHGSPAKPWGDAVFVKPGEIIWLCGACLLFPVTYEPVEAQ